MLVRDVLTYKSELVIGPEDDPKDVSFTITLEVREMSESQITFLVTIKSDDPGLDPSKFIELKRNYLEEDAVWRAANEVAYHFGREVGCYEGVYNHAEETVVVTPYVGDKF